MEEVSIQVNNSEDDEKLPHFRYVTGYVMGGDVQQNKDPSAMVCCDCTSGCRDPNICACLRLRAGKAGAVYQTAADGEDTGAAAAAAAAEGGGEDESPGRRFYNDDGLLLHLPQAIFECGPGCACNPHRCKNRVVSRGVHLPLQVFRCRRDERGFDKGWGLRCLDRIPAGAFVACYLGEVLPDRYVDDRGKQQHDDYVFSLDFAECAKQKSGHGHGHGGGGGGGGSGRRGSGDWGLASPFTQSPRRNGAARNLGGGSSSGRIPGAGGDRPGSLSLSQPSTPRSAPARKKPKRSVSSPLAAAAAAPAGGAPAGEPFPVEEAVGEALVSPEPDPKTVEAFMRMTPLDRRRATFFLSGADGILERALNHYFDRPGAADAAAGAATTAAAAATVVGDDADDEREESDDNENENHGGGGAATAAAAAAAASWESESESDASEHSPAEPPEMPAGLSEQGQRRWRDEFNERERMLYRRGEEKEARMKQKALRASGRRPRPVPAPPREGMEAGGAGAALAGAAAAPVGAADAAAGSIGSKTVSPPSSPAEVLWQELDDASEGRSGGGGGRGGGAAGVAGPTGAFSSFAPAGAWVSGLRSRSPPRGSGGGGGDGVGTGTVVVEHPTSATNVLACLRGPPARPLQPRPANSSKGSRSVAAEQRPISINRATSTSSHSAPCTPPPRTWAVETTPKRSGAGSGAGVAAVAAAGAAAAAGATGGAADGGETRRDEEELLDPRRHARKQPRGSANGGKRGRPDPPLSRSPSPPRTPCSPRSDRSAEMAVDAKAYGNVARFMNHSCDANLIKKMVFVGSHESRMPLVAFFAPENIEAYEELTYDYNYKVGSVEGRKLDCQCGAENCQGRLL